MKLKDKVILTDCDGVLLDWVYSFENYMKEHGYTKKVDGVYDLAIAYGMPKAEMKAFVRTFNESSNIGSLTPFRDAIKYVRKLHEEHGFVFHCITSLSTNEYAGKLRRKNLNSIFGVNIFEKVICLDCGADKDDALLPYKDTDCFWIEDKPENAVCGSDLGLCAVLIEHDYNKDFVHPDISVVKNWKAIYEMITYFK